MRTCRALLGPQRRPKPKRHRRRVVAGDPWNYGTEQGKPEAGLRWSVVLAQTETGLQVPSRTESKVLDLALWLNRKGPKWQMHAGSWWDKAKASGR